MSTNKGYKHRGYRSKNYMANLSNYKAIIEYAKDPNNELDIQYRDNYINIYYLGGSLLKLKGKGSIDFDKHYYYLPSKEFPISYIEALAHNDFRSKISKIKKLSQLSEEDLMKKRQKAIGVIKDIVSKRDNVVKRLRFAKAENVSLILCEMKRVMKDWKKCKDCKDWKECKIRYRNAEDVSQMLSEMKGVMKNWKGCKSRNAVDERTVQHYISLFNKESAIDSDFVVIDLEYKLSELSGYCIPKDQTEPNNGQPRIDIVAIEKSTGQLYVLELKYGLKSTKGKAGVVEHYNDYLNSVGADDKWEDFWNDIDSLVKVQKKDNVLSETISLNKSKPIFGFIYKPEKNEDECKEFYQILVENNLSSIMTIYLPHESKDVSPCAQKNYLKKP